MTWTLKTATVLAERGITTTLVEPKDGPIEERLLYKKPSKDVTTITNRLSKNPEARVVIWTTKISKLAVLKIDTEDAWNWLHEQNYQPATNQCITSGNYPKFHLFNYPPKGKEKVLDIGDGLTIFTRGALVELPEPEDIELWQQSLDDLQIGKSKAEDLLTDAESGAISSKKVQDDLQPAEDESKKDLSVLSSDSEIEKDLSVLSYDGGTEKDRALLPSEDESTKDLSVIPSYEEVDTFLSEGNLNNYMTPETHISTPETHISIDKIIDTINKTYVKHGLSMAYEIGAYVFKVCYKNDMKAYSYKSKKPASLRDLAKRQDDLYVSYSTIQRAVALYHQYKVLGDLAEKLTPVQHRAMFPLDDEKKKKKIAKDAIEHKWTEAQVRDAVANAMGNSVLPGPPRKPRVFKALTRAGNVLSSGDDPFENLDKYLEKLKDNDATKLYRKLAEYADHFNKAKVAIGKKFNIIDTK